MAREFLKVGTKWGEVCIKIARWPSGAISNASPEYEDCRRLAMQHSVALKEVMQEAMRNYLATETDVVASSTGAFSSGKGGL
jgi:hypothetical protein